MTTEPPPRPSRRRRRLIAVVLSTSVALLLGEAGLRLLGPPEYAHRKTEYAVDVISEDPTSWIFRPGSRAAFEWDGDPFGTLPEGARIEDRINAMGMRGPLPAAGRPAVVMLGDSFTYGEGVQGDETFCVLMEALLTKSAAGAPCVLNAGISGQDTLAELQRLPFLLEKVRPRAVVLVYVTNDPIPWAEAAGGRADLVGPGSTTPVPSRLYRAVRSLVRGWEAERRYLSYYTGERRDYWLRTRAAIERMRDLCRRRGVAFGVALFPFLHGVGSDAFREAHAEVALACRELGIPMTDLTPTLAAEPEASLWVHPTDKHPNRRAHEIVAPLLAEFALRLLR